MTVFIAAHVPLFGVVVALVASYEFSSMLSNLLIFGGAGFGALSFLLAVKQGSG